MSVRENAVAGVYGALSGALSAAVERNAALPERVPSAGLVIVRDGEPGEPDVSLNPVSEYYTHAVEVEAYVRQTGAGGAEAALDALLEQAAQALLADPTLGGTVERLRLGAPEIEVIGVEGAAPLLAARFAVFVEYQTSNPLS